ncbi:MAG: cytochrome c [Gemmatimonadales bacterium]
MLIRCAAGSVVALVLAAAPYPIAAQAQAQVADSAQLALGRKVFESKGLCFSCHGKSGDGLLGPTTNLVSRTFTHTKGSVAELVALIKAGISADQSASKQVMPARGGSRISDRELAAVAAYVKHMNSMARAPSSIL